MSHNFELLTELDRESCLTENRLAGKTVGATAKAIVRSRGDSDDVAHEEMQQLVQRVFHSKNGTAPRKVVFCGVDAENASGSICARMGSILASESSQPVCLVDATMGSPRLANVSGVDLSSWFAGYSGSIRDKCVQIEGDLWLARLGALTGNRRTLPSMDELKLLLDQLRGSFGYVLIDAPGISTCGDASLLGQAADAVILVIEANRTRRLAAHKAKVTLAAACVPLLGTVLHNRSFPIPGAIYKRL